MKNIATNLEGAKQEMKLMKRSSSGFTLMEMLIVVTIIGILASIILPRFIAGSKSADKSAHRAERQTINAQLELYFFQNSEYPVSTGNLSAWDDAHQVKAYFPDGVPVTCNQGVEWVVTNGKVSLSGHDGHE
jgi:prepilin-type N-terminal cleavage/methylation domain-containing protein